MDRRTEFDFEDNGRTYVCHVEALRSGSSEKWWWFAVKGDANRYAVCRAEKEDTQSTVRSRVIEYYEARLAPRVFTGWRGRGGAPQKA